MKIVGASVLFLAVVASVFMINEHAKSVFEDAYAEGVRQGKEASRNGDAPKWAVDYITAYCTQDVAYIAAHSAVLNVELVPINIDEEAIRQVFASQMADGTNCINWQYLGVSEVTGQLNWVVYLANGKKGWFGTNQLDRGFVTGLAFELWE